MTPAVFMSRYGIFVAWGAVIAIFWGVKPDEFGTAANFENIFGSQAVLLILTLGLLLSLTVNEFDLSIAGVMAVAITLLGVLNGDLHLSIWVSVIASLGSGILAGMVNALFIIRVGIPSIVVTLGTGTLLAGVAVALHTTVISNISPGLVSIASSTFLSLPLVFYYGLALTIGTWYLLSYTPLGRYMFFVGASHNVARLSGIPVDAIRAAALICTSMMAALAGIMLVGTLGSAGPEFAPAYLLPAFAAAFLGSTAIRPGRFNAWGTFAAVYFLITGITGLELLGLSGWVVDVFYGGSLVVAAALSHISSRMKGGQGLVLRR